GEWYPTLSLAAGGLLEAIRGVPGDRVGPRPERAAPGKARAAFPEVLAEDRENVARVLLAPVERHEEAEDFRPIALERDGRGPLVVALLTQAPDLRFEL